MKSLLVLSVVVAFAGMATSCKGNDKQLPTRPKWGAATKPMPQTATPVPLDQLDLVTSSLPSEIPEAELTRAKCVICHSEDYLVQQRLTPEQWKKSVMKMQKFGAPISDDEATTISSWLSTLYTTDLADRPGLVVGKAGAGAR